MGTIGTAGAAEVASATSTAGALISFTNRLSCAVLKTQIRPATRVNVSMPPVELPEVERTDPLERERARGRMKAREESQFDARAAHYLTRRTSLKVMHDRLSWLVIRTRAISDLCERPATASATRSASLRLS